MIFDDLGKIETADQLRDLWQKEKRTQNRNRHFTAPIMVSANKLKHLNKIDELQADAIMINLEDGVSDAEKPRALEQAALFVSHLQHTEKKIIVRTNPFYEGGLEEILLLNEVRPDAIRIPKVRNSTEVTEALTLIDPSIALHLSIETKEAWEGLSTLTQDPRVEAFYLGVLDLFHDLGLPQSIIETDNPTMHYILSRFLTKTSALGILPVSFVYQEYQNHDAFLAWLDLEKKMGFTAKGVITPKQAEMTMKCFAPSKQSIERAKAIKTLFESDDSRSDFIHETYGFIDEPIYKDALRLLERS